MFTQENVDFGKMERFSLPPRNSSELGSHNHLSTQQQLDIEVFVLRHGTSMAMEADLIVSEQSNGTQARFGLSALGREEVRRSVENAKAQGLLDETTIIICSPFCRTRESAEIAAEVLGTKVFASDDRLRERGFGELELKSASQWYDQVHKLDRVDPDQTEFGVESVYATVERASSFFAEMNNSLPQMFPDRKPLRLLAVSHGDIAIATTISFEKSMNDLSSKRFKAAELRRLEIR